MIYFIIINICALLLVFFGFTIIQMRMTKHLFADYSFLMSYKVIYSPLFFVLFNLVLIKILNLDRLYFLVIPISLIYPAFVIILNLYRDHLDMKLSEQYNLLIRPLILDTFRREDIFLNENDLMIRAKNRRKKVQVEIVIKLGERNQRLEKIKKDLRKLINDSFPIDNLILIFDYKFEIKKKIRKVVPSKLSLN